jgi:hypothetical protein
MEASREQPENADSSIRDSREPDSNVTIKRDVQPKKDFRPRFSSDEGRHIDEIDVQLPNAESSMRESFEPDSTTTLATL